MPTAYLSERTLDDLMRAAIEQIQKCGTRIHSSKGWNTEISGLVLELNDARARLSRTEDRGKAFSCLGELCWYLAKTNELEFIEYYISHYRHSADNGVVFGGYGPRLFKLRGNVDQVSNVIDLLKRKRSSRQAVIQLFDGNDIVGEHKDIPCTCTLQFMVREDKLCMFTNMRSNDLIKGFPHDIFCFTMLQEIIARSVGCEVGTYKHAVGSLHYYDKDARHVANYLDEGWQPTEGIMPPMPLGDPWPSIHALLKAESAIRKSQSFVDIKLDHLDAYWADLARMLQVFWCKKSKKKSRLKDLRAAMISNSYLPFIDKVIGN
jgi:thymidylate synthase